MNKPKVFIASSSESIAVASSVNVNLEREYEVTPWANGTFTLSSSTISDLIRMSSSVDFAVFIFSPDDISIIRKREEHTVRDNVVFELGLFIGSIGISRCFIVKPRNQDLKLPSDLLGITVADYDDARSDGNLEAALSAPCFRMHKAMQSQGGLNRQNISANTKLKVNPSEYSINSTALKVLTCCLASHTTKPEGVSVSDIVFQKKLDDHQVALQLVKLEKMSLIERSIYTSNYDGEEYYAYTITEEGINIILKNEEEF